MKLTSDLELANTRKKLQLLEKQYEEAKADDREEKELREVTLFSLKQLINEMKEEIAIYNAHQHA